MFLAGEGNEWRANEIYAYFPSYDGSPTFTLTPKTLKTNHTSGEVTQGGKTRILSGEKLAKFEFQQMAEGMVLSCQATASAAAISYFLIDGEDFGLEDSGAG